MKDHSRRFWINIRDPIDASFTKTEKAGVSELWTKAIIKYELRCEVPSS